MPKPAPGSASARARLLTRPFAFITAAAFAYFLAYAVLIPVLPRFVKGQLHGSSIVVGLVSGAFAISALALRPWVGAFGDRRGRRILIVSGALLVAASTAGMIVASSVAIVVLLRLVAGAGEAMFFVGAIAAITDIAPAERRGEAISLFSVSLYLGIAFGPLIGETVMQHGFGNVWRISAALAIVAFALGFGSPGAPQARVTVAPSGPRRFLHPAGIRPGAVMFTSVFGFAGWTAFMPLYADELRIGSKGILFAYGAILVAIRLFGARLPDRLGAPRAGSIGLSLSAAGLTTMWAIHETSGLLAGTALFAVGQALSFPAFMSLAAGSAPVAEQGAAIGTMTAFIDAGFFAGPVVMGVVATFSTRAVFLAGGLVAMAGVVLHRVTTRSAGR